MSFGALTIEYFSEVLTLGAFLSMSLFRRDKNRTREREVNGGQVNGRLGSPHRSTLDTE